MSSVSPSLLPIAMPMLASQSHCLGFRCLALSRHFPWVLPALWRTRRTVNTPSSAGGRACCLLRTQVAVLHCRAKPTKSA
eukprot:6479304-Amphidinium_carterae.1